ncbi:MAG: hypothetical protein QGI45_17635 [Myxococcota bacterium]|jgi:pectate lyase|nr:hypothetical protein [Myxococcota bacterium]
MRIPLACGLLLFVFVMTCRGEVETCAEGQDGDRTDLSQCPPQANEVLTVGDDDDDNDDDDNDDDDNDDDEPESADCSAISNHVSWSLCSSGPGLCEGIFEDGVGCGAFCAANGLECIGSYEDQNGSCSPDLHRSALHCEDSGHGSDYCVCGVSGTSDPYIDSLVEADPCENYPYSAEALLDELWGFARNTSGGDPNNIKWVTNTHNSGSGSLRAALESNESSWVVFEFEEGTIELNSPIEIRSNKTLDGRGRNITIDGTLEIDNAKNIIISDVRLTHTSNAPCTQEDDVVTIWGNGGENASSYTSRNIWFHHVEFFKGGDGLLDVRGGSNITVSWSHFHSHMKVSLNSRTRDGDPAPGMDMTWHHNFFDRITLRGPQFKYGRAHYVNNYQYQWYEYGAGSLADAQFYSENNIYEARPGTFCPGNCPDPNPCGDNDWLVSKKGLVIDWEGEPGNAISVGDLALEDAQLEQRNPESVFLPADEYSYALETASVELATRIKENAGPRTHYCADGAP